MSLGIVLPAAGASSRMRGRDKLLEEIDGVPLLPRQAGMAAGTGVPVLVTLPPMATERAASLAALAKAGLETRDVPDAAGGMSASLRVAAQWATEKALNGMMIVLPDMPDVTAADLRRIAALHGAYPDDVIRATDEAGGHGHPTLLPARLFAALGRLTGDTGAREILKGETIRPCPLDGCRATTDLDTPEAWAAWRARRDGGAVS